MANPTRRVPPPPAVPPPANICKSGRIPPPAGGPSDNNRSSRPSKQHAMDTSFIGTKSSRRRGRSRGREHAVKRSDRKYSTLQSEGEVSDTREGSHSDTSTISWVHPSSTRHEKPSRAYLRHRGSSFREESTNQDKRSCNAIKDSDRSPRSDRVNNELGSSESTAWSYDDDFGGGHRREHQHQTKHGRGESKKNLDQYLKVSEAERRQRRRLGSRMFRGVDQRINGRRRRRHSGSESVSEEGLHGAVEKLENGSNQEQLIRQEGRNVVRDYEDSSSEGEISTREYRNNGSRPRSSRCQESKHFELRDVRGRQVGKNQRPCGETTGKTDQESSKKETRHAAGNASFRSQFCSRDSLGQSRQLKQNTDQSCTRTSSSNSRGIGHIKSENDEDEKGTSIPVVINAGLGKFESSTSTPAQNRRSPHDKVRASSFQEPATSPNDAKEESCQENKVQATPHGKPGGVTMGKPIRGARPGEAIGVRSTVFDTATIPTALSELRNFVCSALRSGPGSVMRCFIERNRRGTHKLSNMYSMYADLEDGSGRLLLAARKLLASKTAYYIVCMRQDDLFRDSGKRGGPSFLGKLRASTSNHTEYALYDGGDNPASAPGEEDIKSDLESQATTSKRWTGNLTPSRQNADGRSLRKELAVITYNFDKKEQRSGKRRMEVGIPQVYDNEDMWESVVWQPGDTKEGICTSFARIRHQGAQNFLQDDRLLVMHQRESRYDPLSSCLVDFRGRATAPSVKNFQLIRSYPEDNLKRAHYFADGKRKEETESDDRPKPVLLQMGKGSALRKYFFRKYLAKSRQMKTFHAKTQGEAIDRASGIDRVR